MQLFVARHPEWSDYTEISRLFEYACQQVSDQKTEDLTIAYRDGRLKRDRLAAQLAFLSPPAFTERALQNLAQTDVRSLMAYEQQVRDFHARLRVYFYPKLFRDEPFDPAAFADLPTYLPHTETE